MRRRGFTLLELLVSLAIISILLGIGFGVLARLGKKDELEATTNAVRALLRRARNASQEERYGARVEVDAARSELRAQLRTTITRFRFEDAPAAADPASPDPAAPGPAPAPAPADDEDGGDPAEVAPFELQGALSFTLAVEGGEGVAGRYGQGLLFERRGAWAHVADRPSLSPAEGIWVEAWVYPGRLEDRLRRSPRATSAAEAARAEAAGAPPRPPSPRSDAWRSRTPDDPPRFVVARKGRAWSLAVGADYAVEVALTGPNEAGGEVTYVARTAPDTLRPERWWRVALAFDGRRAYAHVDGIPRVLAPADGQDALPVTLVRDPAPLSVSDPDPAACFYGVVDELHVATIHDAQRVVIPLNISLVAAEDAVAFDVLGQLDTARHAEPVVVYLTDDERAQALLEPPAAPAGGTRTRTDAAAAERLRVAAGQAAFDRLAAAARKGAIDPGRVRAVVVERTGLVR